MDALPRSMRRAAEVLIALVVYAVLIYFFFRSRNFIAVMVKTSRKTPILMIPYSWIYSVAPVSIVLMLVSYTEEKVRELRELFGGGKEGEQ